MSQAQTLREQYEDIREQYESIFRATMRLVAAYDPQDPEECAVLIQELALAAGCSGQLEAIATVEGWGTPVRAGNGYFSFNENAIPRRR